MSATLKDVSAPRPIALVGCGKEKSSRPSPARLLYTSTLFRLASAYCEGHCRRWLILSAKHGLVDPDEVLSPYDLSLADLTPAERVEWGQRVVVRLTELGLVGESLEVHAGKLYVNVLQAAGLEVLTPLEGLTVGKRLAWYSNRLP